METEQKARALQHWTDQARIAELEQENRRMREALEWIEYDAPARWADKAREALKGGDSK